MLDLTVFWKLQSWQQTCSVLAFVLSTQCNGPDCCRLSESGGEWPTGRSCSINMYAWPAGLDSQPHTTKQRMTPAFTLTLLRVNGRFPADWARLQRLCGQHTFTICVTTSRRTGETAFFLLYSIHAITQPSCRSWSHQLLLTVPPPVK